MGCKESEVQILSPRPDGRPGHWAAVDSFKPRSVGVGLKAMRILLTNDDGIHAEGLECLAAAFTKAALGEVWVVAPADEQSATSHAISLGRRRVLRSEEDRGQAFRDRLRQRQAQGKGVLRVTGIAHPFQP